MLAFCEKCGNVMELKEKVGRSLGHYECRGCGLIKDMRVERIELKQTVFEEPKIQVIPGQLKIPLRF